LAVDQENWANGPRKIYPILTSADSDEKSLNVTSRQVRIDRSPFRKLAIDAMNPNEHLDVLERFLPRIRGGRVEKLDNVGGFSGALFWRVATLNGPLCLRRWPSESLTSEGIALIHGVLQHVARQGFTLVPVPLVCQGGQTFVAHAGHLWELAPWMPGQADFHANPKPARLRAATQTLAQFHLAAATFPRREPRAGPSPGIGQRLERVRHLLAGDLEQLVEAVGAAQTSADSLHERVWRMLSLVRIAIQPVGRLLERVCRFEVPLQPCIRDIWHDHVLFTDDRVTGVIDFGAMQVESVAADVARLLGSMAGDDLSLWHAGLDAYRAIRPLSDEEATLVAPLDRSGVVLGALNWADWIYRQRRHFADLAAVARRLDEILSRLQALCGSIKSTAWTPRRHGT
jgi:Ser/Thr protein kinase RdoA (MazF antagonist)